jgi:hypothetical protein
MKRKGLIVTRSVPFDGCIRSFVVLELEPNYDMASFDVIAVEQRKTRYMT